MLSGLAALAICISCAKGATAATDEKRTNLSIEEIKDIIERDMLVGQYFVTGDLTRQIYNDNCRFKDPTNDTTGVDKYLQAVALLFDPKLSTLELKSIRVTSPKTVETTWDLQGYLKFPWKPKVGTSGSTTYTMDDDGLIVLHDEKWTISPFRALLDSFTPTGGASS
ncbi:hypothetical protein KFL_009160050 [Klebsormidium nitens]|uniref:SnoaL-like domain-containing protein n=1 Tax=Klebsormidium nitens TaxID=105231 RepID=A0A1Y1IRF1_KLENI|nr:hypothetical protein KFL_009160050 [Klebsormidium nitens]|eukprot:GAQ92069.1 hypothetical protein KFL_009160050 [Klebsormidium nitens]